MTQKTPSTDDKDRTGEKPVPKDEQELIGDQRHDHLWWGRTGRLAERASSLAGDNASLADEADAKDRDILRGGHDDDWRSK